MADRDYMDAELRRRLAGMSEREKTLMAMYLWGFLKSHWDADEADAIFLKAADEVEGRL